MKTGERIAKVFENWDNIVIAVAFPLALLVLWEIGVYLSGIANYILPPPTQIFSALVKHYGLLLRNAKVTLYETLAGFAMGAILGIIIGIATVYSKILRQGFYPMVVGFQAVPKVAIAPLLVVWFGYGLTSKVVMSFLIAFFPIVVNTISGLTDVDANLIELVRSMSSTKWQIFYKIRAPHSLPYIFDGFKIALPLAVIGAIIGEFVGANMGLGNLILVTGSVLNTSLGFAVLVVVTIMSIALYGVLVLVEKRVVWWRGL